MSSKSVEFLINLMNFLLFLRNLLKILCCQKGNYLVYLCSIRFSVLLFCNKLSFPQFKVKNDYLQTVWFRRCTKCIIILILENDLRTKGKKFDLTVLSCTVHCVEKEMISFYS